MVLKVSDAMLETGGSDVDLDAHTPETGSSYTKSEESAGNDINVIGSSAGYAEGVSNSSGNRYVNDTDIGTKDMTVEGDFFMSGGDPGAGAFYFHGVTARATSATTAAQVEFTYDYSDDNWRISGDTSDTFNDTGMDGSTVTIKIVCDGNDVTGYKDGTEVVAATSTDTGQFGGILLGSFQSGNEPRGDNFTIDDGVAGGAAPSTLTLLGVG